MEFFDCNCSIGKPPIPTFRTAETTSDLLEEMNRCGIRQALVTHASMRFDTPLVGNPKVVASVQGYPSLQPTWAILPEQTGEQPKPEAFLKEMKANGVKALWAFPNEHHYSLDGLTFGPLFELLQEKRIPLFVKLDLIRLRPLLVDFPRLITIVVNQGPHSLERYLRPLFDRYANLYLDSSYYIVDGLIEEFCQRYGAQRLLFGSAFPDNCIGGSFLRLLHADIPQNDKEAVAGENLAALLEEAKW
jgi:predicted TIM-barrel fold metal-dependent hydrolase